MAFALPGVLARTSAYALGLMLLVCVAIIWVAASQLIQAIFTDMDFNHPFFLTYFNTCGFAMWFGGACCREEWRQHLPPCCGGPPAPEAGGYMQQGAGDNDGDAGAGGVAVAVAHETTPTTDALGTRQNPSPLQPQGDGDCHEPGEGRAKPTHHLPSREPPSPLPPNASVTSPGEGEGYTVAATSPSARVPRHLAPPPPLTWRSYAHAASRFTPMWMVANYAFNLSLNYASVASNSILSNTSSLWTMVICVCFLHEKAGAAKVVAVLLTLGGAVMVALADDATTAADATGNATTGSGSGASEGVGGYFGDFLALLSAVCYAIYTVQLRENVPDGVIMPLFFAYVGVYVLIGGLPVLAILHITGFETFAFPSGKVLGFLALNALLGTNISDVLWAKAVILTSPVVATLALSLTIPLGMVSDAIVHGKSFSGMYVGGALFVLCGFVLVNVAGRGEADGEKEETHGASAAHIDAECGDGGSGSDTAEGVRGPRDDRRATEHS